MMSRYRGRGFYDPLSEMNRLFAQVFGLPTQRGGGDGGQGNGGEVEGPAWAPSIDVLQRDGDLVVRAELPGVDPDDVDLTVQNNILTISGRISEEVQTIKSCSRPINNSFARRSCAGLRYA